jgi:hypothetical protein
MINSAMIFSHDNWFLAGYSPENLYAKTGGITLPFKMSFIYNTHPDINILVDDVVFWHTEYTMAWGPGVTKSSVTITAGTSTPPITSNLCATPTNLLTPDMTLYSGNLQEYKSKKEPLEQIYWLTDDSTARALTYKSITACNDLCIQAVAFDPFTPMPTGCHFTDYYQTNVSMLLHCSGVPSGTLYNITIRGTFPP